MSNMYLPITSGSTLFGKTFVFVGFCFCKHPASTKKHEWFYHTSIYRGDGEWIICLSEGWGRGSVNLARLGLGKPATGEEIAPYAARRIGGDLASKPYEEVKQMIVSAFETTPKWSGWIWEKMPWRKVHSRLAPIPPCESCVQGIAY